MYVSKPVRIRWESCAPSGSPSTLKSVEVRVAQVEVLVASSLNLQYFLRFAGVDTAAAEGSDGTACEAPGHGTVRMT